jgi:phage baseplate assembly protein W
VAVKTLALSGGDLVIGSGGLQLISGAAKIRQDLALCLAESYGTDPYHPEWGSVLPQYIGHPISSDTQLLVQAEVNRVIQQYMAQQQSMLSTAAANGKATTLTTADVVSGVNKVDVSISYDTVRVTINLTTLAGQTLTVSRTVS